MYATIEADIKEGHVVPLEPDRMPLSGRALLVILGHPLEKSQWETVRMKLGWLRSSLDPAKWQQDVRQEWSLRP